MYPHDLYSLVYVSCRKSAINKAACFLLEEFRILNMTEIRSVSCGNEHTLALTTAGQVFSFGLGSRGQLGNGSLQSHQDPSPVDALQCIDVTCISAGGWHSMALSSKILIQYYNSSVNSARCQHSYYLVYLMLVHRTYIIPLSLTEFSKLPPFL